MINGGSKTQGDGILSFSHHFRILRDAGIVKVRREGTKNYYYFDPDMVSFNRLSAALDQAVASAGYHSINGVVMIAVPDIYGTNG